MLPEVGVWVWVFVICLLLEGLQCHDIYENFNYKISQMTTFTLLTWTTLFVGNYGLRYLNAITLTLT